MQILASQTTQDNRRSIKRVKLLTSRFGASDATMIFSMTPSMRCTTPLSRRKFSFSSSWISSAALASSGFIVFVDAQTIKAIKFAPIHTLQPQQPRASVLQRFPRGALVRCDLNSG